MMIKRGALFFLILLFAYAGQASRVSYSLADVNWMLTRTNTKIEFEDIIQFKVGDRLDATFLLDDIDSPAYMMSLSQISNSVDVSLNGQLVSLKEGRNITEVTSLITDEEVNIEFIFTNDVDKNGFVNGLKYSWLSALQYVNIKDVCVFEDQFFGGKGIAVSVASYIAEDIDGKLIASIIDPKTNQEVARNNNCAFSRAGIVSNVEISFPDANRINKGAEYLINVSLVNKEKHDEIIDEIEIPLLF